MSPSISERRAELEEQLVDGEIDFEEYEQEMEELNDLEESRETRKRNAAMFASGVLWIFAIGLAIPIAIVHGLLPGLMIILGMILVDNIIGGLFTP